MKNAIILAAGKGTRMRSQKNKVMHTLIDRPILQYVVEACKEAGADRIVLITGYEADSVHNAFPALEYAVQEPQLGTGHAVMQAKMLEGIPGQTLVINGDGPCIQPETLKKLFEAGEDASLTLLSAILPDGKSYGRIIREENGDLSAIVEAKDCTDAQKAVREVNAGIYCFDNQDLFEGLKQLTTDNAQHEYYLTDLVEILKKQGKKVQAIPADDYEEVQGINDPAELAHASAWLQNRINTGWMKKGVQIMDPARTVIGKDVTIGHDTEIWPDTHLLGQTVIEDYAQILPGSFITDSRIGDHSQIQMSVLENAEIPAESIETGTIRKGK